MNHDQYHQQYMLESSHCGRFKAWQMAAMFIGGMLMLAGGLPLIAFSVIPWLCRLVGLV